MGQPLETVKIAWANDLGYLTINKKDFNPETQTIYGAEVPEPVTPTPVALELINNATEASDITPLPGIGNVSAGLILDNMPEGGYSSLEAVAAVDGLRGSIDWNVVAGWGD